MDVVVAIWNPIIWLIFSAFLVALDSSIRAELSSKYMSSFLRVLRKLLPVLLETLLHELGFFLALTQDPKEVLDLHFLVRETQKEFAEALLFGFEALDALIRIFCDGD